MGKPKTCYDRCLLNPFMPSGLFYLFLDRFISNLKHIWICFSELAFIIEILITNANSVDPDQMLHCAVSDLGLLCLQISL